MSCNILVCALRCALRQQSDAGSQGRISGLACSSLLDMRVQMLTLWKFEYGACQAKHVCQRGQAVRLRRKKLCTKPVLYEGNVSVTDGVIAFGK